MLIDVTALSSQRPRIRHVSGDMSENRVRVLCTGFGQEVVALKELLIKAEGILRPADGMTSEDSALFQLEHDLIVLNRYAYGGTASSGVGADGGAASTCAAGVGTYGSTVINPRRMELLLKLLDSYGQIEFIGWSFGVRVVGHILSRIPVSWFSTKQIKVSMVAGTLEAVHPEYGIAPALFRRTINKLSVENLRQFNERMLCRLSLSDEKKAAESRAELKALMPDACMIDQGIEDEKLAGAAARYLEQLACYHEVVSLEELKAEMALMPVLDLGDPETRERVARVMAQGTCYICSDDVIVSAAAVARAAAVLGCHRVLLSSPHLPVVLLARLVLGED